MIAIRIIPPRTPPTIAAAGVAFLLSSWCSVSSGAVVCTELCAASAAVVPVVELVRCEVTTASRVVDVDGSTMLAAYVDGIGATVTVLVLIVVVVD